MIAPRSFLMAFEFVGFAWLISLLVPALIALYFLKLKRREVVVSSTFLWKRSIEDLHVNSPFQKLRRSLLLLLQLLALLALVLSASRPVITGASEGGRNLLVLIDNSASMNAREEGGSRLDLARREAQALVEGMVGGDRMAVIAFSDRSQVLRPLTADRAALKRSIEAVPQTALPTDLLQALKTVEALAASLPTAEVYLIGDGAYGELATLSLDLQRFSLKFVRVGKGTENLGISELDVRRTFGQRQRIELFASVHNFTREEKRVALGIYRGERLVGAAELQIPAGRTRSHTFDVARFTVEGEAASAVLRLEVDPGGLLPDDDRAYVKIAPPQRLPVLVVGEENPHLDRVLAVEPLVDGRRMSLGAYLAASQAGTLSGDPARILIFDRRAPPAAPDRPALYLGCHPPLPELLGGGEGPGAGGAAGPVVLQAPVIVDWDRSHPVNRFLAFADLKIEESLGFAPGRAYRSLIDTGEKSIAGTVNFLAEGRPPVTALIVGFDLMRSNWPWLHSFPIFFTNALEWLGTAAGSEARPRYRTGEILSFYPGERKLDRPVFRDPEGREHIASPDRAGELSFAATERSGVYELRSGGEVLESYPVSLLSAPESEIAPRSEIRFGSQVIRSEESGLQTRDLWKWFALAALGLICLEWWVYNRRMHI